MTSKQNLFLLLALVSLVLVQGVSFYTEREAADALRWRKRTLDTLLAISGFSDLNHNTVSLVREFVLTGGEPLGLRADKDSAEIHKRLAHARQLVGDETNQVRRLDRLDATLKELTDRLATTLAARRTQGKDAAAKLVAEGIGRRLSDEAEFILDEMEAEENRLLTERNARAERSSALASGTMKIGGGLTLLFGFLAWRALRAATAAVRASEESLAVTLQSICDGVLATDAEGRITRLNAVAEALTGWMQADAAGHPVAEVFRIINETTRQPAFLPVADTLAKGTIHGLANHTILIARDGTERPIADSCAPIRNRDGEVTGAVLVFRDVTEEKEAERALRASKQELETVVRANHLIMEHSLDVICTIDEQGRFTFVSAACTKVWGYQPEELVGRNYIDLVHPEDHPKTSQAAADILAGKPVRDFENRYRRKDGSLVPIVWSASWSAAEKLMFCVAHDVTERKRAEVQMAENRRTLADFKAALDEHAIVAITDARGKITYVNDKFCTISKYAREELLGRDHRIINSGHHPKAFIRELWETITSGRVWKGEIQNRAKDGSLYWVDTTIVPFLDTDGKPTQFIAIRADITKRKLAEDTLRTAHQELNQANAELGLGSRHKDEFLANMSHELRTPLNAILGMSELLTEQLFGPLTPRQAKSVNTISSSGQHLLALINDILDLSKIEADKMELHAEPLNVDEFCQSCLVFVKTQAMQKQIYVDHQREPRPFALSADPKRFKQILVNLLTNAVKFTPQGGRIGLTVAAPEGEGVVRFTVWDSGIGIAAEDQTKLFRAFTQVDSGLNRTQEGTGLGLALVAKLVELHGGSVALESEPGKGSRFIVTLPVGSVGTPPAARPDGTTRDTEFFRRSASQPSGTPPAFQRALIIEDDPTAGEQLVHHLTQLGLSSVVHARGEESVEVVLRERPDFILLDLQLPGASGWVVLTQLKEHPQTRDIPVVTVSVMDEPEKSRALGAAAHFTKPVTRDQLAALLQRSPRQPAPTAPCPQPQAPGSGPLILLAEDNEAIIATLGSYLQAKGYDMHFALNGLIAVKLARELRPVLILMDIQMPVTDGLTAIRELRADAAFKNTPIIALTALAMSGDRERCLAAGATDYMSKPVKLKELAELMEKLLGKRDA